MNKNYVWVNPVIMVQYDIEYLKYILSKNSFEIVLPNKNCSDIVKNKYRKKYLNSDKCIIDSRCPKIYEYIDNNDNSYEYANINPILIETAIELKAQIENNIIIITPCVALSNFGNSLNLEGLIFKTWIEFVKENNIILDENKKRKLNSSPIPLGFFKGFEKVYSVTGEENILKVFKNKLYMNSKILEALYCDNGCHNGDGIDKK